MFDIFHCIPPCKPAPQSRWLGGLRKWLLCVKPSGYMYRKIRQKEQTRKQHSNSSFSVLAGLMPVIRYLVTQIIMCYGREGTWSLRDQIFRSSHTDSPYTLFLIHYFYLIFIGEVLWSRFVSLSLKSSFLSNVCSSSSLDKLMGMSYSVTDPLPMLGKIVSTILSCKYHVS